MFLKLKYFVFVSIIFIAFSCKVNQRTTVPRNLERIYDPSSSKIHPEIKIFNYSDSSSLLVERIKSSELLFNQANPENKLLSRVQLTYNLYDLNNKQNLVDSTTTTFKFDKNEERKYQIIEVELNSSIGNSYLLEVITTDLNRRNSQYSFLRIDRTEKDSPLDFIYYNKETKQEYMDPYIRKGHEFGIKHRKKDIDSLYVFYFGNNFKIPVPPYQEDTLVDILEVPDTSWVCYQDSIEYANFENEGLYYFSETLKWKDFSTGFSLFNFGETFPVVRTPEELAKPIQYLGSLDSVPGKDSTGKLTKLAVDDFWLDKANNIDKSRELLKAYYNRVMLANKYFTSYKEGWQTDRGMIYIIYGLPDYLFKSGDEERWIYNPQGIGTGIEFSFKFVKNPFTFNHYVLDRDKLKVTGWDEAVEMWNKGEVIYFQYGIE